MKIVTVVIACFGILLLTGFTSAAAAQGLYENLPGPISGIPLGRAQFDGNVTHTPLVVVGDPDGSPPDSPSLHVDPNVPGSLYAGVGSVQSFITESSYYMGSGALITRWHVLTAAHLFDIGDDGQIDFSPADVQFNINYNGDLSSRITASAIDIHPDFTGFNNPSVNDDLAIITLSQAAPVGVPYYNLWRQEVSIGQEAVQVGYGQSGDGVNGYGPDSSLTIKRLGRNCMDTSDLDDEGSGATEVYRADFDYPDSSSGRMGGASLGNDIETTLGPGDSGGPSFISYEEELYIIGNNTFLVSWRRGGPPSPDPPYFGSGYGGMLVYPYLDWIDSTVPEPATLSLLAIGALALLRRRKS